MSRKKNKHKGKPEAAPSSRAAPHFQRIDVEMSELEAILDRAKASLTQEEYATIHAALETLLFLTKELGKKSASLKRLKDMLFGATTEKTRQVLANALKSSGMDVQDGPKDDGGKDTPGEKAKPPGHGRNGADGYTGGQQVCVPHESRKKGDACPECRKGTLYDWTPGWIVRITGQAPLSATVYKQQKLRCNLCSTVFSARLPDGLDEQQKYDARSAAMIALLKYGTGLPFNRLQRLQGSLGIPLPASTQWEIVDEAAGRDLRPAFEELLRQAAQGQVVHNDDTTMKILDLAAPESEDGRKGVFTSGIVSTGQGQRIAVFFTGRNHAGENLAELLKRRARDLDKPIQMCDALSRNMPEDLQTIVSNCLAHGRRKFTDVAASFPEEVAHVLGLLGKVYGNDATAKARQMSDEQRLTFHHAESGPLMAELETWMAKQIDQRKVEPNSALGEAIAYMQKHWPELTLFLRQPGAPLDNNICERALKKAILHRKNAYFYKTENGARVGDLYMSLIHTCELNGQNPFEYLTELQEHGKEVAARPELWMPWNYREAVAAAAAAGN